MRKKTKLALVPTVVYLPGFANGKTGNLDHEKILKDCNRELLLVERSLPMSFSGALDNLIMWRGMTEEQLAEASELSVKTIQRLRNDEPSNVSMETVMQLCIGMKLPPPLSGRLMTASGHYFMATELHLMYQYLLETSYFRHIYCCNKILVGQGLKPLGRLNKAVS